MALPFGDSANRVAEEVALAVPLASQNPSFLPGFPPFAYPIGMGPPPMQEQEVPTPWYLDISGVWRRHRASLVLAAMFAALFGFLAGTLFSTRLWSIDGRLRFTPTADGKDIYKSMSLLTYVDLVLSDDNVERLAAEFRAQLPPGNVTKYLKSQVKVEAPRNTEIIELSFETPDPTLGVALINRLMQMHIEYANELRRTTMLRQSLGMLRNTIEKCDAQVRKWQTTIDEYQSRVRAGTPIEKLDQVELDSAYSQRRRSLYEEMKDAQAKLEEWRSVHEQKMGDLRRQDDLARSGVGVPFEHETARAAVRAVVNSMKIVQSTIDRKQEDYRNLPIEYANLRILDQQVQMKEAQADLRQLSEKLSSFGSLSAAGTTDDPADTSWTKLRGRLLGADSPEFDVLKPATRPPYPATSNRKMLTAVGFAAPLLCVFLLLAFIDHCRGLSPAGSRGIDVIAANSPLGGRSPGRGESALLTMRFQQWIVEPSSPPVQVLNGHAQLECNLGDTPVPQRKRPPAINDGSASSSSNR